MITEVARNIAISADTGSYHLSESDVNQLFEGVAGLATLEWFSLVAQLICIGVLLVVVLVIAIRRF